MPKVLVVEDDNDLRFIYNSALSRQGLDVVAVSNTVEALLHLTNQDFDVILLDMNMPDMPGLKLVEFAHDDVRLRHVPIIVVSATEQWRAQVTPLGVRHFMVKPVTMYEVIERVNEVLKK